MSPEATRRLLHAVAAHGLQGSPLPAPQDPLQDDDWSQLLGQALRCRVTGHLVAAIRDGALAAKPEQQDAALASHERALARDLLVERRMLEAVAVLEAAGVPVRVLKGSAVAHTVYPDPALRSFGDVDVLVPSQQYDHAVRALCRSGARRRFDEPRPGFDRRFGKGVCLETTDGFEIDVHRTFVAGPFGLAFDTRELFGPGTPFVVGGRRLVALDAELRFVHACFQAALGDAEPRPVALRDVAQMLVCGTLDHEHLRDVVSRWRCGVVLRRAIRLTWEGLSLDRKPPELQWLAALSPSPFERRALRCYVGPNRSYAAQAVAGLPAVPGLYAKAVYTSSLLLPRRSYVEARDGSYGRRVCRGLRLAFAGWTRR